MKRIPFQISILLMLVMFTSAHGNELLHPSLNQTYQHEKRIVLAQTVAQSEGVSSKPVSKSHGQPIFKKAAKSILQELEVLAEKEGPYIIPPELPEGESSKWGEGLIEVISANLTQKDQSSFYKLLGLKEKVFFKGKSSKVAGATSAEYIEKIRKYYLSALLKYPMDDILNENYSSAYGKYGELNELFEEVANGNFIAGLDYTTVEEVKKYHSITLYLAKVIGDSGSRLERLINSLQDFDIFIESKEAIKSISK